MSKNNDYISIIKNKFEFSQIKELLDKLNNLSVLVIGDTIIDHYVFVNLKGRAIKDPILSVEYKNREIYAGGILATSNHISNFVEKIKVVTLIGDRDSQLDFIDGSVRENIELKTFVKEKSPTTVKKRMIDYYRNNKLFKIEYIDDKPINEKLTREILDYLDVEVPKYDLIIVNDFGHGFINEPIRRKLEEKSKFLAINVQSNSANMGYNYFNLYQKPNFITLNEEELRLPISNRFEEIDKVIKDARTNFQLTNFLITLGKKGCIFVNENEVLSAPIITKSIKDSIGAGDALFAITSLLAYVKANPELIPFLGNCAGGLAANIMGNKESITKEKLLDFIGEVYENELGRV